MRFILAILCWITFVFTIVAPFHMTVTMEDYEDCMRVYTKMCQSSWVCEWLLFTYNWMPWHIEHVKNVGYYSQEDLSWHAYWCIVIDKNPLVSIQNTIYCSMVYLYY